jgi:uncharacterized protein YecE (DUF72 family)
MVPRIGTSGYSYKEWKGSFYPPDMKPEGMLAFYTRAFRTVEINNTFYRMPTDKVVAGWADEAPQGFSFVLKAPQRISHQLRLKGVQDAWRTFLRAASELGPKQGPLLVQLPPNFKKDLPRLEAFLSLVPAAVKTALEFRHDSWFSDDVFEALKSRGIALCTADTDEGTTPLVRTADWGYLRLRGTEYAAEELASWVNRIGAQGWSDAWVFFKHEDEGKGPALAHRLEALFSQPQATPSD